MVDTIGNDPAILVDFQTGRRLFDSLFYLVVVCCCAEFCHLAFESLIIGELSEGGGNNVEFCRKQTDYLPEMTAFQLKLWASLFMLVDHAGVAFFDDNLLMRGVGRLSMPIFAFLLVEGFRRTHNLVNYFVRILLLGILSQPIYLFAFPDYPGLGLNILFTLALGLLMLHGYAKSNSIWVVALAAVLAEIANLDYGSFAILLIFVLYRWDGKNKNQLLVLLLLPIGWQVLRRLIHTLSITGFGSPELFLPLLPTFVTGALAWFAGFFIAAYNHQAGWQGKNWFYLFYPCHLLAIGWLKTLL